MTNIDIRQFAWSEKYRPKTIDDCILPQHLKSKFKGIIKMGDLPSLCFTGTSGVGKTTVAQAIADELDLDFYKVNSSLEGNIDTLRTKIKTYVSTMSIEAIGKRKLVLLDEADGMNPLSFQPALRALIEEFIGNAVFILTGNKRTNIIPALYSRCPEIRFTIPKEERPLLASQFLKRLKFILDNEKIQYEEKVLVELVQRRFPDFRRCINDIQSYSLAGSIDIGILSNDLANTKINDLVSHIKTNNLAKIQSWTVNNLQNDVSLLFEELYDYLYQNLKPESVPDMVVLMAEYIDKMARSDNPNITFSALCVELMQGVEFKI